MAAVKPPAGGCEAPVRYRKWASHASVRGVPCSAPMTSSPLPSNVRLAGAIVAVVDVQATWPFEAMISIARV